METFTIWRLSQDLETFTGFGDFQSVARFMPHSSRVFLDSDTFHPSDILF